MEIVWFYFDWLCSSWIDRNVDSKSVVFSHFSCTFRVAVWSFIVILLISHYSSVSIFIVVSQTFSLVGGSGLEWAAKWTRLYGYSQKCGFVRRQKYLYRLRSAQLWLITPVSLNSLWSTWGKHCSPKNYYYDECESSGGVSSLPVPTHVSFQLWIMVEGRGGK